MKKNSRRKLTLSKDTLMNLANGIEGQELQKVAGGITYVSESSLKVSCTC